MLPGGAKGAAIRRRHGVVTLLLLAGSAAAAEKQFLSPDGVRQTCECGNRIPGRVHSPADEQQEQRCCLVDFHGLKMSLPVYRTIDQIAHRSRVIDPRLRFTGSKSSVRMLHAGWRHLATTPEGAEA